MNLDHLYLRNLGLVDLCSVVSATSFRSLGMTEPRVRGLVNVIFDSHRLTIKVTKVINIEGVNLFPKNKLISSANKNCVIIAFVYVNDVNTTFLFDAIKRTVRVCYEVKMPVSEFEYLSYRITIRMNVVPSFDIVSQRKSTSGAGRVS